jgi:hypothetical protein
MGRGGGVGGQKNIWGEGWDGKGKLNLCIKKVSKAIQQNV